MAAITGAQLFGDTFQIDQGTVGTAIENADGSYAYTAAGTAADYGLRAESLTITSAGTPSAEDIIATLSNGDIVPATIVANDASDFLVSTSLGAPGAGYDTVYVYETNNPADQPADGSSIIVGAIADDNPYDFQPVCFLSGTLIRTTGGDAQVEHLCVGDLVVTAGGRERAVRWLGHRTIDCRQHRQPHQAFPVRIAAHAFGAGLPARDLILSPGHAICVDAMGEVLIPAAALVNGTTVSQVEVETVTYWHVELESHDVILAEGLPCESYLEMGNRSFFAEAEMVELHALPDAPVATHADFCRPYVDHGPQVDLVRSRLAARARALADERRYVSAAA